jgi:phage-related protein
VTTATFYKVCLDPSGIALDNILFNTNSTKIKLVCTNGVEQLNGIDMKKSWATQSLILAFN